MGGERYKSKRPLTAKGQSVHAIETQHNGKWSIEQTGCIMPEKQELFSPFFKASGAGTCPTFVQTQQKSKQYYKKNKIK